MSHDPSKNARRFDQRILIRDVEPVTPCQLAPKAVVGDQLPVTATLVAEGHDLLAARLKWRRSDVGSVDRQRWAPVPMVVDEWSGASGILFADEPGLYNFQIEAYVDRFATWRRDLILRRDAGDDLQVEFLEGASILGRILRGIPKDDREMVKSSIDVLKSDTCTEAVKLRTVLDGNLFDVASGQPVPGEATLSSLFPLRIDRELAAFGAWYELFPRSDGGFKRGARTWKRLEAVAEAGFDIIYLPPVHPIGATNRKGRNNTLVPSDDDVGSPWAIGSSDGGHEAIDPGLGDLADFRAFVGRSKELGLEVALDYALQCSPDHPWVTEHPEWFNHRVDGTIRYAENPPKKYQDIYPINFWPENETDRVALWVACLDLFELWIERGVHVFRVDNPHTKPLAFWKWVIAEVQRNHPEIVFLSEAFTDPPMMHSLAEVGFTQSYTYFTWRHDKDELTRYGQELARGRASGWFRPNLWPSTPDILTGQLRHGSAPAFELRALLAATLSPSWGIYSGYELLENDPHPEKEEYHYSEKYELKSRDFDSEDSIWGFISALNRVRRQNPAFRRIHTLRFHHVDNDDVIAYSHVRPTRDGWNRILVVANLQPDQIREATVHLDRDALRLSDGGPISISDQITGESWNWSGYGDYVRFGPAERVGHIFRLDYGTR